MCSFAIVFGVGCSAVPAPEGNDATGGAKLTALGLRADVPTKHAARSRLEARNGAAAVISVQSAFEHALAKRARARARWWTDNTQLGLNDYLSARDAACAEAGLKPDDVEITDIVILGTKQARLASGDAGAGSFRTGGESAPVGSSNSEQLSDSCSAFLEFQRGREHCNANDGTIAGCDLAVTGTAALLEQLTGSLSIIRQAKPDYESDRGYHEISAKLTCARSELQQYREALSNLRSNRR
jgi:hypothetical protein